MKNSRSLVASEIDGAAWFKSTYSGAEQACVEVADLTATAYAGIAVCDSKNPTGPALLLAPAAFHTLVAGVRSNSFGG
ncbi:DUF397 domain-containing protein [Streptomyces sp. CS014]|uniref:DUF397 domain-containing protein n=1 Tax=Streptomyces sp. CS014 TaxID=2162707 RepID=UPI000D51A1B7|nr:DUF397 domain-containing protein [Streptomyces sp. CS014]PVD04476.1 DUF397 domain-containing protein [Streptomyces sp. CS014]